MLINAQQIAEMAIAGMQEIYLIEMGVAYIRVWYLDGGNLVYRDLACGGGFITVGVGTKFSCPYTDDNFWTIVKYIHKRYISTQNRLNVGGIPMPKLVLED